MRVMKLKYPKDLFTAKEVKVVPKKKFRFPKAWKFKSEKKDWILELKPNLVKKHYFVKRR